MKTATRPRAATRGVARAKTVIIAVRYEGFPTSNHYGAHCGRAGLIADTRNYPTSREQDPSACY